MNEDDKLKPVIDLTGCCKDEYLVELGGYELKERNGKLYAVKKQPKHPKTYEECCKVLGVEEDLWFVYEDIDGNHINPSCISNYRISRLDLYHDLEKLLICRDAYWKIAGGDWKPDWKTNVWYDMYYISFDGITIAKETGFPCCNMILVFPTEEMRDAFYENFKDLIEKCKELL